MLAEVVPGARMKSACPQKKQSQLIWTAHLSAPSCKVLCVSHLWTTHPCDVLTQLVIVLTLQERNHTRSAITFVEHTVFSPIHHGVLHVLGLFFWVDVEHVNAMLHARQTTSISRLEHPLFHMPSLVVVQGNGCDHAGI